MDGIAKKNKTEYIIPQHNEIVVDYFKNKLKIELFDVFNISNNNFGFVNGIYLSEKIFEFDQE